MGMPLGIDCCDRSHVNDLANRITSLQNVGWLGQTLEDGPRHLCAGDSLQQVVSDIGRASCRARLQLWVVAVSLK